MEPSAYPAAKANRTVAMFYFLWRQGKPGDRALDITRIVAADPKSPAWGTVSAFHWWGEPYFGFYRSDDAWVIARHARQLVDAGVDVVVFDVTNAVTYEATRDTVLETYAKLRAAGQRTPRVAFIAHSKSDKTITHLYDTLYAPGRYADLCSAGGASR